MAFPENIKMEVKHKSAFQCCRCRDIGVEIHHIIPQADGGLDDFDNAAPLCPSCHDRFGANPEKRKEIKSMRDWWYQLVSEKHTTSQNSKVLQVLDEIKSSIEDRSSKSSEEIKILKDEMIKKYNDLLVSNTIKKSDSSSIMNQKISNVATITQNLFLIRRICPFCSRDVTWEIENDIPGFSNINGKNSIESIQFQLFLTDIFYRCPYCKKNINLKNI